MGGSEKRTTSPKLSGVNAIMAIIAAVSLACTIHGPTALSANRVKLELALSNIKLFGRSFLTSKAIASTIV